MKKCFECETTEDLQEHHVVPRSRGGTRTITLCNQCHLRAHGRDVNGMNHSKLTKAALAKAKENGTKLGASIPSVREATMKATAKRREATNDRLFPFVAKANENGFVSLREVASYLNNEGITTPRGKAFTKANLSPIMKRYRKQNTEISKEDK